MSYRVEYVSAGKRERFDRSRGSRRVVLTLFFLCLFLMLTGGFWAEGRALLQRILIPGDAELTLQALETMAEGLRQGNSLGMAVEGFCREIIQSGH